MAPINRGFATAGALTVLGTLVLALVYVGNPAGTISNVGWRMFGAVVGGLVLAQIAELEKDRDGAIPLIFFVLSLLTFPVLKATRNALVAPYHTEEAPLKGVRGECFGQFL